MKLNRIITLCAVAATLALSAGTVFAQQDNGGDNGGQRRNRQGGGGPGGFGNMTPEERQQAMLDRVQEQLGFTNSTDWEAVKPLVQKVNDARRDVFASQMRSMFGGRRGGPGGGGPGGPGGFGGQASPEQDALENALKADAPAAQVKDLLAKYKASQQAKQAKLEAAQDALKAVLTSKQEAQAYLLGLVR